LSKYNDCLNDSEKKRYFILSGIEVIALFDSHNVWKYAKDSYFLWHIESPNNFVQEIDNYIALSPLSI